MAVIGASEKAGRIGSTLVAQSDPGRLSRQAFTPLTGIIPRFTVCPPTPPGLAARSPVDLAIIAIPIKDVPEVIRECGQAGIKAAIIISAGGREVGPGGKEIEAAIKEEAAARRGALSGAQLPWG